ncbi:hypothetical protein ACQRBV_19090 [Pseudomonas sp. R11F]|uniref:hypothetical protein n=1 Tax=Pseudomonas TaxID=286 RepID=UPI001374EEAF|nr:hypothetical protein [Pseudomonas sp. Q1]
MSNENSITPPVKDDEDHPKKCNCISNSSIYKWFSQENKLADTKTIFDSLRNMGICVAMLLGLPSLYSATGSLCFFKLALGIIVIVASVFFATANVVWTMESLKEKSKPWVNLSVIIVGGIVIIAFAVNAARSLPCL